MKRLILLCAGLIVISLFFANFSYAKVDPAKAAGVWLFDEGKGDVAKDSSGKGNDGKLTKNLKWVEGKFSKALEFNGTDTCVSTEKKLLDNLAEFTIVLWAKPGNIVATRVGLVGQNDAPEFGFIAPTTIQMWDPIAGGLDVPYNFPKNEWHHIAAVSSKTFVRVYIDGKVNEMKGNYANHGTSAFNVNIGGCGVYDATGNWFTGVIDDVAIFHAVLEEADIKDVMDKGLSKVLGISPVSVASPGKLTLTWGHIKAMSR